MHSARRQKNLMKRSPCGEMSARSRRAYCRVEQLRVILGKQKTNGTSIRYLLGSRWSIHDAYVRNNTFIIIVINITLLGFRDAQLE